MTLTGLVADVRRGVLTPREAVRATLDRIDRLDGALNAFASVRADEALAEADTAPDGPLRGAVLAVKDVIDVAGWPTTAGSRLRAGHRATRDAETVARLRRAGAVIVGKTNTHEFAYGPTTTSSYLGPARNPWATDRICGGSSGGSAAAAVAGLVPAALGTDTAGSIRMPAALCGATGLRPTTGLVPTDGVVPVAETFDTVGPIARTAEDCGLLLEALVGRPYPIAADVAGMRIGLVDDLFRLCDADVADAVGASVEALTGIGASVVPVETAFLGAAGAVHQALMLPEAAAWHRERLGTRLGEYDRDVRRRLLAGVLLPATAYVTAARLRRTFQERLARVLEPLDVLVAPAMPCVAPPIRPEAPEFAEEQAAFRRAVLPFNAPWSLAGLPVLTLPCGVVRRLPVGLAVVARRGAEETLLRVGTAFQEATDWHEREPAAPPVSTA